MKLDNEDQRKLLLNILANTQLSGTITQLNETIIQVNALGTSIQSAEVYDTNNIN